MNRWLRILFLGIAALLAVYAVLFACYLNAIGYAALTAKTVWSAVAGAVFFTAAAWRFSLQAKFRVFMLILSLALVEGLLQAMGWLGVLPGVNIRFNAPYGRAYWTAEGHGNGIRNRFGWNYPEFDFQAPKRIVVVGDSFVEADEVGGRQNEAAILQQLLRAQSPEWAVFALGMRGTSPAFYLEMLDYAARRFAPQEAIVCICLGNDINESSPSLDYAPPADYIYYDLDSSNHLVLNPASVGARDGFNRLLEMNDHSMLVNLPMTVNSHCMILQSLFSIRDDLRLASTTRRLSNLDPKAAAWGRIGSSLKPFAVTPGPEARHAMEVMLAELALLQQKCDADHIKLRLVTIPFFPPQFYAAQHGSNWTLQVGAYDFLRPDREIAAFAHDHHIPFLSFADWLAARKTDVNDISSLYFCNGSGHFTERGHRLCAEAMNDAFYTKPQP